MLCEDDGTVSATCAVLLGGEVTYTEIAGGAWLTDSTDDENTTYVAVHRVATDKNCRGRGLASRLLMEAAVIGRRAGKISLRIDHHGSGTPFAPEELVDPTAAACAEMIYDILQLMGVTLTAEMAIPLYTGTATDTGCFRYANTSEHTFLVAAACAATGAKLQPINQALFDTVSLNKLKVQAWVTTHTQFYCDGQVAVCPLPVTLAEELGVGEEEVGGMSGFVRSIEGVKMAATLRESSEGKVFLSLRGVPGCDCAKVCEIFGGGGHKGAAGGNTTLPLQEATKILIAEMKKQFEM